LHLLQDLTSPAHVRNSAHPHVRDSPMFAGSGQLGVGDPDALEAPEEFTEWPEPRVRLPALALTPCDSLEQCFGEVQEWTQRNFFSKKTVGRTWAEIYAGQNGDGPADRMSTTEVAGPRLVDGPDANGYLYAHIQSGPDVQGFQRRPAARIGWKVAISGNPWLTDATVDEAIAREQWEDLGDVAVRYSAKLIYLYWKTVGGTTPCSEGGNYDLVTELEMPSAVSLDNLSLRNVARVTNRGSKRVNLIRIGMYLDKDPSNDDVAEDWCLVRDLAPGATGSCFTYGPLPRDPQVQMGPHRITARADDVRTLPLLNPQSAVASANYRIELPTSDCVAFEAVPGEIYRSGPGLTILRTDSPLSGYYFFERRDAFSGRLTTYGGLLVRQSERELGWGLSSILRFSLGSAYDGDMYSLSAEVYNREPGAGLPTQTLGFDLLLRGGKTGLGDNPQLPSTPPSLSSYAEATLNVRVRTVSLTPRIESMNATVTDLRPCRQ